MGTVLRDRRRLPSVVLGKYGPEPELHLGFGERRTRPGRTGCAGPSSAMRAAADGFEMGKARLGS